ncbi:MULTISPECIES: hypothetical protein [unclassified Tolypothrix]|uniref:hypothetical protein n=1 Tax=unclassified Tolypothrix TaxID=2649714 RepID=UPI0005EAA885|nr:MULTISPECIES: hypothetical protein [unclassified Tolypothrix]BAY95451.1 hypothetical protein NIES3275_75080 [Microchaete diplosiphon NIES-3275]EKF00696.1 hypothetical protein FDUTEX481_08844 [Tolypothrix sp. PCC 7601]MBE9084589.1 hypothetical protein [Tolypothrix sp. LEGE 11397]UYD28644.1 hypothetical protein HGR01_11785 [Tolypothrix sp. PCC 7712]UYD35443.1 hypothetical protein HG267_06580 [Tolypothrix sp. PCC 7601]
MATKKLEALITKTVKKVIKKELGKLKKDNLGIALNQTSNTLAEIEKVKNDNLALASNQTHNTLDRFVAKVDNWQEKDSSEEIIDEIYTNGYLSLPSKEDTELERKLRELKFKQELRKDWILFLLKDVIVYSATIIFIFAVAGFYLFTLIMHQRY